MNTNKKKNYFKRSILSVLLGMMLCAVPCFAEIEYGVAVYIDGAPLDVSGGHEAVISDGRTLVPMRAVFEALGAEVVWDESESGVTASLGDTALRLYENSTSMYIENKNGETVVTLDVAPSLMEYTPGFDSFMVPLRAVSEAFDKDVSWNENTKTVTVTDKAATADNDENNGTNSTNDTNNDTNDNNKDSTTADFDKSQIIQSQRLSVYDSTVATVNDNGTVSVTSGDTVQTVSGAENAVSVSLGRDWGVALRSDGKVIAWGTSNNYGQLGSADAAADGTAHVIDNLENIKKVCAGSYFGIALSADGKVYTWGRNDKGQLGHDASDNNEITQVDIDTVTDIAAGDDHALALLSGGSVYSWGANSEGQLGRGSTTSKYMSKPAKVPYLQSITSVYAGVSGSAAIRKDTSVYCWGTIYLGQPEDSDKVLHWNSDDSEIIVDEDGYYRYDRPRRLFKCYYSIEDEEYKSEVLLGANSVSCGEYQFAVLCGGTMYCWGASPVITARRVSQYLRINAQECERVYDLTAIAADNEGTVYALDAENNLVTIGR